MSKNSDSTYYYDPNTKSYKTNEQQNYYTMPYMMQSSMPNSPNYIPFYYIQNPNLNPYGFNPYMPNDPKQVFLNKLSSYFLNNESTKSYNTLKEEYYEWKIEKWDELGERELSPEFTLCGYKWKLSFRSNKDKENKENCALFLQNLDVEKNFSIHPCVNVVFGVRNYNDYSCFHAKNETSLDYFCKDHDSWGYNDLVKKSDLTKKDSNNKSLLEDNKIIIFVYIRLCDKIDKKEKYMDELKKLIKEDDGEKPDEIIEEIYYEWEINNWSDLDNPSYSPQFSAGGDKWKIKLYPSGNDEENHASICLENFTLGDEEFLHTCAKIVLVMRNYNKYTCFTTDYTSNAKFFNFDNLKYSTDKFIEKKYLVNGNSDESLISNNKTVVGALIRIIKINNDQFVKHIDGRYTFLECLTHILNLIDNIRGNGSEDDNEDEEEIEHAYNEWLIDDWNGLVAVTRSPEFKIHGHKWNIVYVEKEDNYIFLLRNSDIEDENYEHVNLKFIFSIHNYKDYSLFDHSGIVSNCFSASDIMNGSSKVVKKPEIGKKSKKTNKYLIEDNKVTIGLYTKLFGFKKDSYMKTLKETMKNSDEDEDEDESNDDNLIGKNYFEWEINDWNALKNLDYSPKFTAGGLTWRIVIYPNGDGNNYINNISLYLENVDITEDKYSQVCSKFLLVIRNSEDYAYFKAKKDENGLSIFKTSDNKLGFSQFIKKTDFHNEGRNSKKALIENNKVVIGAYVYVYKNGTFVKSVNTAAATRNINTNNNTGTSSTSNTNNTNNKSSSKESLPDYENEEGDLAIALYDFKSSEISFKKDDYLRITNWNNGGEWVFGYKSGESEKKGQIPVAIIKKNSEKDDDEKKVDESIPNAVPLMYPKPGMPLVNAYGMNGSVYYPYVYSPQLQQYVYVQPNQQCYVYPQQQYVYPQPGTPMQQYVYPQQPQPGSPLNQYGYPQQPQPGVAIQQPQQGVAMQQPQPGVAMQQPQPRVAMQQPQPGVAVQQPQPGVAVQQPQPGVAMQQPQPGSPMNQYGYVQQPRQSQPGLPMNQYGYVQQPQPGSPMNQYAYTQQPQTGSPMNQYGYPQQPQQGVAMQQPQTVYMGQNVGQNITMSKPNATRQSNPQ